MPPGTGADVLFAAFALLVHGYSGQDDIQLGRVAGSAPDGTPDRRRVRSTLAADTSFASLVSQFAAPAGPPPPATEGLRVTFVYTRVAGPGAGEAPDPAGDALRLQVVGSGAETRFTLHHDTGLFTREFADRMAANYRTLLADACRRPTVPIHELAMVSLPEAHHLLHELNDTARPFPHDATVHGLVEAQVQRTPEAPAVEWQGAVLSYRDLNAAANRLARALRAAGVAPGGRVGVCVGRSAHTVSLLLAVHKLGCAYVPLDPAYPAERLAAIAATADMAAVVFDAPETPGWLTALAALPLAAEDLVKQAAEQPADNLDLVIASTDPTHLIYTSGSTGLPKGVVVSHRNVAALLAWAWRTYSADDVSRVLFGTSLNFDLSVFEMWCPLTLGGCVVVVDNVLALTEPNALRPSLINTVPSALNVLLQRHAVPRSTVVLNVAGEPLARELVNAAFADTRVRRLYNLYGPSEDTTYSTWKCFTGPTEDPPTIGVPVDNTVAYLLDAAGRLVPLGVPGELYLGGAGVAGGYINDPQRTAAVFVEAPTGLGLPAGTRLYRTGDLARWTADGELDFLGRRDNQVKVRGYRIELGEIEAALREVVGLRDVAALAVRHHGDARLVCWLGVDEADGVSVEQVAAHLRATLPYYMQPARIVLDAQLPLLPNGKVDRRALAAREIDWSAVAGAAPGTDDGTSGEPGPADAATAQFDEHGQTVAGVWTDLLGLAEVRPDLDFFSVGGHSLLANLLAARLAERSGTVVRVSDIYENRTLAEQITMIRRSRAQAPATAGADDVDQRLAALAETLHRSATGHGVPGAAIAAYVDGRLEFAYHGFDDVEAGRPRTAESRQRMTCITKVLVAYVALMLVDRGLVGLDESLAERLPLAFRRNGVDGTVEVTLRQLLSHTSGVDDSFEVWNDVDAPDLVSYVGNFRHYGQLFEPGLVYAYSACGTAIVALLIEELLGKPWRWAVNELLLTPLGIREIPPDNEPGDHYGDTVATGYLWSPAQQRFLRHTPPRQTIADDSTSSFQVCFTIGELATIAVFALQDGVAPDGTRLLSAQLAEQMRTPQVDIPGHHFMHAWGLGWLMFGPTAFGFNSNGSGQHNFIQIFPERRTFLLLLANAYPVFGLYEDLLQTFAGQQLIRTGRPFDLDLDDCVGRYVSDGYQLHVFRGPEHLRYEYHERSRDGRWCQTDEGDLVSSGAGGFTSMSPKNILAGSISFIPTPGTRVPGFVRLGQRLTRRAG
ncbi:amino acid adenylation domain-containing protein [Micromonospora sp. NPDC049060]|uniref:non-ribosomal peptide synthetase n=1 Tax=unclassified Micromonospora TaxID=2617518 RepID=UPI0033C8F56D